MYHFANGKTYFKVPKKVAQRNAPYGDEPAELVPQGAAVPKEEASNGKRVPTQEKAGASMDRSAFALPKVDIHKGLSQLQSAGGEMVKGMQNAKFVMPKIKPPPVKMGPIIA